MKKIIIALIVVVLVGVGVYFLKSSSSYKAEDTGEDTDVTADLDTSGDEQAEETQDESQTVLGKSGEGRDITAYHYGDGDKKVLFVGGIHGGYSPNTSLLAYELMDHLEDNSVAVPDNVRVSVIPILNPDGLYKVLGTDGRFEKSDIPSSQEERIPGRFNAGGVDLNRNFDCDWQTEGVWQSRKVDAGSEIFSEPESQAMRDFVTSYEPDAVVVWYSAAGGVFASSCHNGVLGETKTITKIYSDASGYPAFEEFDFYEITGDMVNWLAKEGVPAISVLLTDHRDAEWSKNKAGIEALLEHYAI